MLRSGVSNDVKKVQKAVVDGLTKALSNLEIRTLKPAMTILVFGAAIFPTRDIVKRIMEHLKQEDERPREDRSARDVVSGKVRSLRGLCQSLHGVSSVALLPSNLLLFLSGLLSPGFRHHPTRLDEPKA